MSVQPPVIAAKIVCVGEDCVGARSEWIEIEWAWDDEISEWAWEWKGPLPDGWEDIYDGEDDGIDLETGEVYGYCPTCMIAIRGIELPGAFA